MIAITLVIACGVASFVPIPEQHVPMLNDIYLRRSEMGRKEARESDVRSTPDL